MTGPFNAPDEDIDLIIRFKSGEEGAFGEILDKYQKPVINFIRRFLGVQGQSEAEDISQDVFIKIYKALAWYQPRVKFTTYLYKVATNSCISYIRKNKKRAFIPIQISLDEGEESPVDRLKDTSRPLPGEEMLKEELALMIEKGVQSLKQEQRIALILNQYHGQTYQEIAAVLGCSKKSVERRLYRARMNLKEKLLPYLQRGIPVQ